jgi:DamX protein
MSETTQEEDRWYAALGLERDPFPEQEGAPDFFARGGRERQLKALADLDLARPLVGVVGEVGVGKTTLFHALLRELPDEARVARVTAGVFLSASALLLAVARAMGLEIESNENRESLRGRLRDHIDALSASGAHAVIMVDDAGDLETDALEEMVALAALGAEGRRVKVLLFARPGLRDALARAVGSERLDALFHEMLVERYSLNELRGYLQFRLARAGLKGPSPFTEEDYQVLFRRSGGIPGKANGLARALLRDRRGGLGREQMLWIGGGVGAALILLAIVLVLLTGGDPPEAVTGTVADAPAPGAGAGPAPAVPEPDPPEPDAPTAPDAGGLSGPERAIAGTWEDLGADPDGDGPAVREAATDARSEDAAAPDPGPSAADDATETVAGTAEAAAPAGAAPAAGAAGSDAGIPGASILSLDPGHWTLQVLVNSSSARARGWIEDRPDPDAYRFYRRTRDGVPQYVVVYGDFADRAAASIASDRLAGTGVSGAFTRSVGDVQAELRAAQ